MNRAIVLVMLCACGAAEAPEPVEPVAVVETEPETKPEPPAQSAPCFAGPPLVATSVYYDLERFSASLHMYDGTSPLPTGDYGTCSVRDAEVYDAEGRSVAMLGCGILVKRRGIVDHIGLQIGASGQQVIDRHPGAEKRIVCMAAGEQTECWFRSARDYEEPQATYTIDVPLGAQSLEGAAAIEVLAAATVTRFHMTIYCH
jgi:hypothetical protein